MKNLLNKFKISILLIGIVSIALIYSCSSETQEQDLTNKELDEMKLNGMFSNLNINMTTKIKREDVDDVNKLVSEVIKELYEVELSNNNSSEFSRTSEDQLVPFTGVDLTINDNFIIITPFNGVQPIRTLGDDEQCGGKAGDGWKLYETCSSEDCVKKSSDKAVMALTPSLKSGKCMDIRIKRNTFNAKVCARVISCN